MVHCIHVYRGAIGYHFKILYFFLGSFFHLANSENLNEMLFTSRSALFAKVIIKESQVYEGLRMSFLRISKL